MVTYVIIYLIAIAVILIIGGFFMNTREIQKFILEKKRKEENFSISAESRFGASNYEVFHFDFKNKLVIMNYSIYSDKKEWQHETRQFETFNVAFDENEGIKLTIRLVPIPAPFSKTSKEHFFDFFSTGTVIKVI